VVAVDAVVWGSSCTKLTKCTGYLVDVESLSSGGGCGSGCVLCVACGGHQRCTHLMSGVCSNLPKQNSRNENTSDHRGRTQCYAALALWREFTHLAPLLTTSFPPHLYSPSYLIEVHGHASCWVLLLPCGGAVTPFL